MKGQGVTSVKEGLTSKEVIQNRKQYGNNIIHSGKQDSFFKKLLETLGDPIIKILLVALLIKTIFLFQNFDWFETLGIVIAIFLASFISTISEYGSEQAFNRLQEESSKINCKVVRDRKLEEIPIDEVVVGDIVLLQAGDKVPADGILVSGDLAVDESSLNGETKEAYKEAKYSYQMDEHNSLYRGTVIYSGEGYMQVLKVGDATFYGKMAKELQEEQPESPLKIRLRGLAKVISRIGYGGAILVSLSYLFSVLVINNQFNPTLIMKAVTNFPYLFGQILYALTLSVTIIVVAVPEGLPMMITLVLSSNMKRMLKNNVLVRKLVGIETAGSLNILFTDKTGTLTKGKLEVVGFQLGSGKSYQTEMELKKNKKIYPLVKLSIMGNNASTYSEEGLPLGGNMTDRALLAFLQKDDSFSFLKKKFMPFDSKIKYSSATVSYGEQNYQLIKGAPEKVISLCTSYLDDIGNKKNIVDKNMFDSFITSKTREGIRVLALAYGERVELSHLTLLGFIYIKDEVRKEAIEGVKTVQKAGIQVVMITGDRKDTATSIGKETGILKEATDLVLTSDELKEKTDEEVVALLPRLKIVARSLPQDKSRLVKISQSLGLVVGMTGDGVNDAPALKKADVGFAMGSGTEVAKEASEIVILDDNFLSISKAILFGRTIFKSIRKFIIFQLTVNLCAILLSIVGPFIGVETPVTVIQMLWINMIMDTLAGIAFAYEPPLKEYMEERPKKRDEAIINEYMLGEILFTGLYSALLCIFFLKSPFIHSLFRFDIEDKYFLTAFFGLFIFMGIFNCFNARTSRLNLFSYLYKNKAFMLVILFILIVQICLIYYGGTLFRTFGLTLSEFEIMTLLAFSVVPVDWMRKLFLRGRGIKGGV